MEIRLEERASQPTLTIRRVVSYDQLGSFMGEVFPKVFQHLKERGLQPISPPFSLYRQVTGNSVDVESGFALAQQAVGEGEITPNHLPGGKVAVTMHVGHYDSLMQTHQSIERWVKEQGLAEGKMAWELYVTDPGLEPDSSKWQSEVCWLVH